jgi:hypothetical protein
VDDEVKILWRSRPQNARQFIAVAEGGLRQDNAGLPKGFKGKTEGLRISLDVGKLNLKSYLIRFFADSLIHRKRFPFPINGEGCCTGKKILSN